MCAGSYSQELTLLEQVHVALGLASKLEEFYLIVASMLVDPNTFGFSRAFFLRYDERTRTFSGRLALGAGSREEHERFRNELLEEARRLKEQVEVVQRESPEALALQPIYNLRYHSLWIQLLQGREEGTGLNDGFQRLLLRRDRLSQRHLLEKVANASGAVLLDDKTTERGGLEPYVQLPAVAGRLFTRRGLHSILIADRLYEDQRLGEETLYHFQWLLNHASVALENVELVEQLQATTQRLQEVDRLKTTFLSIVSHELRTPLTSIIGFVHLLAQEKAGPVTQWQRDLLRRISQHSAHLQSMVNDILEIAEVEAGGMINVHLEAVDPLAALLTTIPKIEARRGAKKVAVEPVMGQAIPMVLADASALERIYYHLLDNAVKFTPGEGKVLVEFHQEQEQLDIAIVDTGIGISQENLKLIFNHFYQVDSRLERNYGGMGIGLTVVKLLLAAIGGKIRVESTPGHGSRFVLTFPVAEEPA